VAGVAGWGGRALSAVVAVPSVTAVTVINFWAKKSHREGGFEDCSILALLLLLFCGKVLCIVRLKLIPPNSCEISRLRVPNYFTKVIVSF
jgi:hypothetical protein